MEDNKEKREITGKIKSILDNVIDDFNSKWDSHSSQRAGINEATNKILQLFEVEPVEEQSVVLSAEEYFSESGLYAEGKLKTDIIKLLEGFADLRVQQEREKREKENQTDECK